MRLLIIFFLLGMPLAWGETETANEHLSRGNDELKAGYLDRAIMDYTKAIEMNGNLSKAFDNRGIAYAKEKSFSRAIADFTMAIASNPKDADAYNNRGLTNFSVGNYTQSIMDYTRAIELNTFYDLAYTNRELAYYQIKEYDKAWSDVHTQEAIGGKVDEGFVEQLKKTSGRQK